MTNEAFLKAVELYNLSAALETELEKWQNMERINLIRMVSKINGYGADTTVSMEHVSVDILRILTMDAITKKLNALRKEFNTL